MVKLYVNDGSLNDATSYYVRIITDAITRMGYEVSIVSSASSIHSGDDVIVIEVKQFFKVWLRRPRTILCWFQGIAPEEVSFQRLALWKKIVYPPVFSVLEKLALRRSDFCFFVSESMRKHYARKYGYNGSRYLIMPCFNQTLNSNAFESEKYCNPSFVYTGNMAGWQCFDETVSLFSRIREKLPSASLAIYTGQKDIAQAVLDRYKVDAEVKYVPSSQISNELKRYKYGFLIRQDDVVNNVATPTKMNTYISCGVIPIFSDVIHAFSEAFQHAKYCVKLNVDGDGLDKLFQLESEGISMEKIKEEYEGLFASYYSRERYISEITKALQSVLEK